MKKLIPLAAIMLLVLFTTPVYADTSATIQLSPEPIYNQIWAYETYTVNITLTELNLTTFDLTGYTGTPANLRQDINIRWRGKGGYDFGSATTGYNYNLDEQEFTLTSSLEQRSSIFNLTLDNDALDYGMKPFESVEITIQVEVYLVMSDDSLGPRLDTISKTYQLVDETKVEYLEGKYEEMQEEINTALQASGLESFNREKYQNILNEMNNTLGLGNYVEALDIWDHYNEKDRSTMINGIISASNTEYAELESHRDLQDQVDSLEQDLELLQLEYDQLENTYSALANTYSKVNQQLDSVKGNLSTAITAVFLSAIVFYFLGRRGARKEAETEIA